MKGRAKRAGQPYGFGALISDYAQWRNFFTTSNLAYLGVATVIYTLSKTTPVLDEHKWDDYRSNVALAGAVAIRNLILVFAVYSGWHHVMYRATTPLSTQKYNPKYPPEWEHAAARRWTLVGSLIGSVYEIGALWWWSTGRGEFYTSISDYPLYSSATWLLACFVSDLHFWLVHRMMHPWGWTIPVVGDIGGLLYRHVHYIHHLRHNPGPWAGLAMHPVEHIIYFSRSLWLLAVPCHPLIFLWSNIRAMIGPAPGHHGFEDVYGSRFHLIHHSVLRTNYGTRGYEDKFFGTFTMKEPVSTAQ